MFFKTKTRRKVEQIEKICSQQAVAIRELQGMMDTYKRMTDVLEIVSHKYDYVVISVRYGSGKEQKEDAEKKGYRLAGFLKEGEREIWIKEKSNGA